MLRFAECLLHIAQQVGHVPAPVEPRSDFLQRLLALFQVVSREKAGQFGVVLGHDLAGSVNKGMLTLGGGVGPLAAGGAFGCGAALVSALGAGWVACGATEAWRSGAAGAVPVGSTPAEFDRFLRAEMGKWGKVIREAGIKLEQ